MQKISGNKSFDASRLAEDIIKNGTAKKNLAKLLQAHSVSEKTITEIFKNSFADVIGLKRANIDVVSDKNFIFSGINQRDVGNLVNFELGAARYEFGISEKSMNGLLLYNRPNDLIKKGDIIFSVYSTSPEAIAHKKEKILTSLRQSIYENNNHCNKFLIRNVPNTR